MSKSKARSASIRGTNVWRSIVLPAAVASASLSIAAVGAILLGQDSGIDGINRFVETLSGRSGTFLGDLGVLAPLGFAFAAGMVSAVNPCGFAMLPAYLGLYLGSNEQDNGNTHPIKQLGKGLKVGTSVTAGFIVLFGAAGIIIGLGARAAVVDILPWLGLIIGIILAITGSWMIGGGKLYTGFAARAASHMGDPGQVNVRGYFLFGLSYGTASLSCTLPIFLSVIGTSFAVSSIATSLGQFLLYALGMGVVILTLTLGISFFKSALGAILSVFPRYGDFRSRSPREEYWYWVFFVFLGSLIASILDAFTTGFLLYLIFVLGTFLPSLAVSVRRLHDVDRSGWWILLSLVPIIGPIILLIWYVRKGTAGENRFGDEPAVRSTRLCPQCRAENHSGNIRCTTCGVSLGLEPEMVGALRKALPYIQNIGSWLMVVAGSYIVFYWLTIGGLL